MSYGAWVTFGGDKEARTPDLLNAIQALSQLSYTPKRQILCYRKTTLLSSEKCKEATFCEKQICLFHKITFAKNAKLTFLPRSSFAVALVALGTPDGWWQAPAAPVLPQQQQTLRQSQLPAPLAASLRAWPSLKRINILK